MVGLGALWLPILVSSVLVFVASSLVWMVLPHHRNDWKGLPGEAAILGTLDRLAPGQYRFPFTADRKEMRSPEFAKKMEAGPMGLLIVMPKSQLNMGKSLVFWFMHLIVISTFTAYLAGHTLSAGATYLAVFRVVGTVGVLAYAGAIVPQSIWWGRTWSSTLTEILDGVVYGLLTAGAFGWLWPR
jgi:hypothetical protein